VPVADRRAAGAAALPDSIVVLLFGIAVMEALEIVWL
jgi:hypothetical protein